jgi:hypothetical protein
MWNIAGLLGLIGLICGVLGIEKVLRPWKMLKGGGFAILGILLGASVFHIWLIQLIYPRMYGYASRAGLGIGQISAALQSYADEHAWQYPDPNRWCDLLLEDGHVKVEHFVWPSVVIRWPPVTGKKYTWPAPKRGRCFWAMNPNCRTADLQQRDMVLLFEANEGWNQFGGPELATSKYHDGVGCRVLLNDGRVQFVKEQQIRQLKWKTGKNEPDKE